MSCKQRTDLHAPQSAYQRTDLLTAAWSIYVLKSKPVESVLGLSGLNFAPCLLVLPVLACLFGCGCTLHVLPCLTCLLVLFVLCLLYLLACLDYEDMLPLSKRFTAQVTQPLHLPVPVLLLPARKSVCYLASMLGQQT